MKADFWLNRKTVIVVNVPGSGQHQVSAEVLFEHLAKHLAGQSFAGGETCIVVNEHGRARVERYQPSPVQRTEGLRLSEGREGNATHGAV